MRKRLTDCYMHKSYEPIRLDEGGSLIVVIKGQKECKTFTIKATKWEIILSNNPSVSSILVAR